MNLIRDHRRLFRNSAALALAGFAVMVCLEKAAGSEPSLPVQMIPANFTALAKAAGPAVVNIRTVKPLNDSSRIFQAFHDDPPSNRQGFSAFFEKFFKENPPPPFKQNSLGSGFILDGEGYIATNYHVVEKAEKIDVVFYDGSQSPATLIGFDADTDLALIRVHVGRALPTLPLGDSVSLEIGQWVLAIGNPFGLDHTITAGIISAKNRFGGAGPCGELIQTDAAINPGNSGGPLLNMNGEVIGINSAAAGGGGGIGFAIPSSQARLILDRLKENSRRPAPKQ